MEKKKEVTFKGEVATKVYSSDTFSVYGLKINKFRYPDIKRTKYGTVSISGDLPELSMGVEYNIIAVENEYKGTIGYRVININREVPMNGTDIYLFLCEILTPNQAKEVYANYPNIIQLVKENRTSEIDVNKLHGIGETILKKIIKKIEDNFCLADLVTEFQGYLTLPIIRKLYDKYTSVEVLRKRLAKDPYASLCSIAGIGFKKADSMLLEMEKISVDNIKNGKPPIINLTGDLKTSLERCLACMKYLLEENETSGHTKMNLVDLRSKILEVVPDCAKHFNDCLEDKDIYADNVEMEIALERSHWCEEYIADTILSNLGNYNVWDYDVEKYRDLDGCVLTNEQMNTARNLCKYNISILNGGSGTGKSQSTLSIIKMLDDHGKSYRIMTPTGRSAKVASEYTHREATTIHRGLGYVVGVNPPWTFNKDNKLHVDVIIIDETSMVDIWLFKNLIDAIDFKTTKLLLIGDDAQLPSVGCGNILHDLIECKKIPTTTLTQIFRYGEGGLMKVATDTRFCKPYLSSSMKGKVTKFGANQDYTFIDLPTELVSKNAVALYQKLLLDGYSIHDIQVLSAMNKGECGSMALNNAIQKVANKNYGSEIKLEYGDTTYYEGDIVIQKANNYKAEIDIESLSQEEIDIYENDEEAEKPTAFIANGEIGIVKSISKGYMVIDFDGIMIKYYKSEMMDLGLGYAISIHKSQGGSSKVIILLSPQSHAFFSSSNLLYVGLTRMKEKCFHLGSLVSVNQAVTKKANLERRTFLLNMLVGKKQDEKSKSEQLKTTA